MSQSQHHRQRWSPKSPQESRKVRTGSKALAELLRASEERFKQFFETWPEYCYMISPSGNILDVNPAACKALGYSKEELIGRHVSAIYAPESLSRMGDVFEKWKRSGEVHDEELICLWGTSGEIHLTVADFGKGFDTEAARKGQGLGLISMQERLSILNGTLSIESQPKCGTTIHARLPVSKISQVST